MSNSFLSFVGIAEGVRLSNQKILLEGTQLTAQPRNPQLTRRNPPQPGYQDIGGGRGRGGRGGEGEGDMYGIVSKDHNTRNPSSQDLDLERSNSTSAIVHYVGRNQHSTETDFNDSNNYNNSNNIIGDNQNLAPPPIPNPLSTEELTSLMTSEGHMYATVAPATHPPMTQHQAPMSNMADPNFSQYGRSIMVENVHSTQSFPPPIPIIEEVVDEDEDEDDIGAEKHFGKTQKNPPSNTNITDIVPASKPNSIQHQSLQSPPRNLAVEGGGGGVRIFRGSAHKDNLHMGPLPRITTTPSSQTSSPLSELGSPDTSSESGRKTITTV